MDGAQLSRFPHLSWLGFHVASDDARPLDVHMRGQAHCVSLTLAGSHSILWNSRGRDLRWSEDAGTVHFIPADGEEHGFRTVARPRFSSYVLLVPRRHLRDVLATEGHESVVELPRLLARDDAVLTRCMTRLARTGSHDNAPAPSHADEAARLLVLRLVELGGGGRPDWHDDTNTFDRRTLGHLVERIDANLRFTPALADLALLCGLSPSHFARKFRNSTGVSLERFVNRRRLQTALDVLRSSAIPLADVSLDLGFSSQSHFTRLFSGLTGMTPARYRKHRAPTLG